MLLANNFPSTTLSYKRMKMMFNCLYLRHLCRTEVAASVRGSFIFIVEHYHKLAKAPGTIPAPVFRSPTNRHSYTSVTYSRESRLVPYGSVSVSPSEPRLVYSMSFLVVSLTPLAPTSIFPLFCRIPKLRLMFVCFRQLLDAFISRVD